MIMTPVPLTLVITKPEIVYLHPKNATTSICVIQPLVNMANASLLRYRATTTTRVLLTLASKGPVSPQRKTAATITRALTIIATPPRAAARTSRKIALTTTRALSILVLMVNARTPHASALTMTNVPPISVILLRDVVSQRLKSVRPVLATTRIVIRTRAIASIQQYIVRTLIPALLNTAMMILAYVVLPKNPVRIIYPVSTAVVIPPLVIVN
jgi:hypothetical protein